MTFYFSLKSTNTLELNIPTGNYPAHVDSNNAIDNNNNNSSSNSNNNCTNENSSSGNDKYQGIMDMLTALKSGISGLREEVAKNGDYLAEIKEDVKSLDANILELLQQEVDRPNCTVNESLSKLQTL